MLDWLAAYHQINASLWMSDTVTLQRFGVQDGVWAEVPDVPCQVQSPRAASSPAAESIASPHERSAIWVYLGPDVEVAPGDRVLWSDEVWEVNSVVGMRTGAFALRVECSIGQSALQPEMIAFRRRQAGQWVEVGTFEIRFTRRSPVPVPGGSEDTADGAIVRSTLIGGDDAKVVQIGDWFTRDGFPGRVVERDVHEAGRSVFTYEMEAAVP